MLFGSIMGANLPPKYLNKCLKAGMKKSKPDINQPVPRGGYCGLWVELKRRHGPKPRSDQENMLRLLASEGNAVFACRGSDAAIRVLESYIKGKFIKVASTGRDIGNESGGNRSYS